MIARTLLALFTLAAPVALAQIPAELGLYGPATTHIKAGDLAPDLKFDKLLSSPAGADWNPANLYRKLTILIFYLNTSKNIQTITIWNSLVDQYADKPVQFLFISGEEDETLAPFLKQHPIKGWVFHDLEGKTGKAYGLDIPTTVFIAPDRTILGFRHGFPPQPHEIEAALGDCTNATQDCGTLMLSAEPPRMPRFDDHKPKLAPSYALHVATSTTAAHANSSGDDFFSLGGVTLKEAILQLYGINPVRASFPASVDDRKLYNFDLVLPEREDHEKMRARMQQGIEDYFHLNITPRDRVVDVYIASIAPGHKPLVGKQYDPEEGGSFSAFGVEIGAAGNPDGMIEGATTQPLSAVRGISVHGSADDLFSALEGSIDRPVINETKIQGIIELEVKSTEGPHNDFLDQLRERYGIILTPAQRTVSILAVQLR